MSLVQRIAARLTVLHKLALVTVLFLVPIGLLGALFVEQSQKDAAFALKERDGVTYLRAVWPIAAAALRDPAAAPSAGAKATLAAAGARFDGAMNTAKTAAALAGASASATAPAAQALISAIGDGSNLILDPDLDSYYVMDVVLLKLPTLINDLRELDDAAVRHAAAAAALQPRLDLAVAEGHARADLEGVLKSIDTAAASHGDDSLRAALAAPRARLTAAAEVLTQALAAPADLARLRSALSGLRDAADAAWGVSATALDDLLAVRVDAILGRMWQRLAVVGIVLAVTLALVVVIGRSLAGGVATLAGRMTALVAGDRGSPIPYLDHGNELGRIARAVAVFRDGLARVEDLGAAAAEIERRHAEARDVEMRAVASDFEQRILGVVDLVGAAAEELEASAGSLSGIADSALAAGHGAESRAGATAEAGAAMAGSAQALADEARRLSAVMTETATVTAEAEARASATGTAVTALADAAERIGEAVRLIHAIAEQTNLLALNATIEAARAGAAGRGFAIVASEVKQLASETGRATDAIAGQVSGIQAATRQMVEAIASVNESIGRVGATTRDSRDAMTRQMESADAISGAAAEMAEATRGLVSTLAHVGEAADETDNAARQSLAAAHDLGRNAVKLRQDVAGFVAGLRRA